MQLKKIGVIFLFTLIVLMLLIGIRTGFFRNYLPESIKNSIVVFQNKSKNREKSHKTAFNIENVLIDCFKNLEIPKSEITIIHLLENSTIDIKAAIPRGKPMEWIIWQICSSAEKAGYITIDSYYDESPSFTCFIQLKSKKNVEPSVKITLQRSSGYFSNTAKMAIIIADFNFHADVATVSYLSFQEPVTISLVSSGRIAESTAAIVEEYKKEIILLIPMEPLPSSYSAYRGTTILLHHTEEKIRSLIEKNISVIPYYTGFANLFGAQVLCDSRVMKIILEEIKNRNSYLLIDQPPHCSIAATMAQKMGVPYCTVDIALDSSASSKQKMLSDTLHHAALIAQKTGSVIVSGRATEQFITAIKDFLPYFSRNGIRLVPVSELVIHQ